GKGTLNRMRGLVALCSVLAFALATAGCGGSKKHAAPTTSSVTKPRCPRRVAARWTARLEHDVAAIRRGARRPTKDTLKGNPTINAATDRFLVDVNKAPGDLLVKNRFIDHAAAPPVAP